MYPVTMSAPVTVYQTPGQVNCTTIGNQTRCTTVPGAALQSPQSDVNAVSRAYAINSCLQGKGYTR
jgi:hypothetical protein